MPAFHPTIHRLVRGCRLLLATGALLTGANAQIVNGGFESPTPFAGWTLEYGRYANNGFGTYLFGPWQAAAPVGHPAPAIWTGGQPFSTAFLAVQPYNGNRMARLNDPFGGFHATRLRQSFNASAADAASGTLAVQWGAVLEYAHIPGQPGFRVEVFKNGISAGHYQADTNDAVAEGWQATGVGFYYKHSQAEVTLPGLAQGDPLEVVLTVWDCGDSAHGGFAFFDDVRFLTCTPPPPTMVGWWHDSTALDLAGPNLNPGAWNTSPPWQPTGYVGPDDLDHDGAHFVSVPHHEDLNFKANQSFSIDLWVKPQNVSTVNGLQPLVSKTWSRPQFPNHQLGYALYLDNGHPALLLSDFFIPQSYVETSVVVPPDEWTHLAVTVERRASFTPVIKFFVNGSVLPTTFSPLLGSLSTGADLLATFGAASPDLRIGRFSDDLVTISGGMGVFGGNAVFFGKTDEVELFRRALLPVEVMRVFAAGTKGKCKGPQPDPWDPWDPDCGLPVFTGNDVMSSAIALPFTFVLRDLAYHDIHVSTNGFFYLSNGGPAPGSATGFGSAAAMVASLRNGPPRIAPYWADLDLQPANNASVCVNTFSNPDRVVITWLNAVEAGSSVPKTIQCQLFASGEVLFGYSDGMSTTSTNALCGISSGGGIADPGASNLFDGALSSDAILYENFDPASHPFDLGGNSVMLLPNEGGHEAIASPIPQSLHVIYGSSCYPGMSLTASPAPLAGTVVTYTTNGMPEVLPGAGIYVGMTIISFGQLPSPGLDLGMLGAPGCSALVASLDITMSAVGVTPTQDLPLAIPAVGARGLSFYVQALALASFENPAGFVTSNGIASTIP